MVVISQIFSSKALNMTHCASCLRRRLLINQICNLLHFQPRVVTACMSLYVVKLGSLWECLLDACDLISITIHFFYVWIWVLDLFELIFLKQGIIDHLIKVTKLKPQVFFIFIYIYNKLNIYFIFCHWTLRILMPLFARLLFGESSRPSPFSYHYKPATHLCFTLPNLKPCVSSTNWIEENIRSYNISFTLKMSWAQV